jgi:hypothetical protein
MDATELANLVERRLASKAADIQAWTEWRIQLEITDALLDAGHKAFMEYLYPGSRDACDIVVTRQDNCAQVNDWIELKPILEGWFYWNPSKFIGGAAFKHDIRKLAALPTGQRWFLMVMFAAGTRVGNEPPPNPQARKTLTPDQVIGVISYWAKSKPVGIRSFPAGAGYCHLVLWSVQECCEDDIKLIGREYALRQTEPGLG